MKFESTVEQLLSGVSLASRFVQKQGNLPVLSSILIAADNGAVVLRATNLECGVEYVAPAKVSEHGVVAVPAGVILGFLSNTRDKQVTATLTGEILKVQTDRMSASIKTLPHDDFPTLPRISAERSFTVKAGDFARVLRSVIHCAATSTIKPELQSVLLFAEAGKLTAAATDSFRLAEKTVPLLSRGGVPQLLLPARNAAELLRILEGRGGSVEVYYDDNQLSVQVDNMYYTSRLIDGAFPNYQQVVPKEFSTEGVVLREDFAQALKSLTVFADKFSQVSFLIEPKKKAIELSSHNADVGDEVCTLKATASGDSVSVNFNSRYLADSLLPLSGESVRIRANGPGKPLLIKDAADDSFFYLAMPMNR